MAIYQINREKITPLKKTTFSDRKIFERQDIQRLIRQQIEIISEDTLVIAEEYGGWKESKRRIDLLCIDKEANLVVVELKRTEDGGHMELQAVRYSAMVSTMTFEQVVDAHNLYLENIGSNKDAKQVILEFLEWDEPSEDAFAQDVRIVLASANFSKELTSTVLWLNEKGVDIRCVKMEPFVKGKQILLDIQQVIPLPETADFQVKIRRKKQKEQQSKRDLQKFTLIANGEEFKGLNKRKLIFKIVEILIKKGLKPKEISDLLSKVKKNLFKSFDEKLNQEQFTANLMEINPGGRIPGYKRYFYEENQLFYIDGKTYALTNQWGLDTVEAAELLCKEQDIRFEKE